MDSGDAGLPGARLRAGGRADASRGAGRSATVGGRSSASCLVGDRRDSVQSLGDSLALASMESEAAFQRYGPAHLVVIVLTIALPFLLAAFARKSRWPRGERIIARILALLLGIHYVGYAIYLSAIGATTWDKELPLQLCD